MKRFGLSLILCTYIGISTAQTIITPDKRWGNLFKEVQQKRAMGDNKTFVDMVPQGAPAAILRKYQLLKNRDSASLRAFVLANFYLPATAEVSVAQGLSLNEHLNQLWNTLTRKADKKTSYSSLLPLPQSYIVPGGRFREVYYWDSYFTMQGLAVSDRYDLIENMLDNFKYLVDTYGHIPNGNRSYYLSRSQPPYFALMVQLLQEKAGDAVYKKYFSAMEKEYFFWMNGAFVTLSKQQA
ncbi:MAG TPA: trehalase family glycosidase, partial [Flavisolibacter sp.]|nr:trehalase family glycosidase [Flavisolibacter sp.]